MLSLNPSKIKDLRGSIAQIESLVANGIMSEAQAIAAIDLAMKKTERLKREYVDKIHKWNDRDKKPRTKSVRGNPVTYFMTHIRKGTEYKQLSASTLDDLYRKLYAFYTADSQDGIRPNATLSEVYEIYMAERRKDAFEYHTISTQTAEYDEFTWKRFFADSPLVRRKVANITQKQVFEEFKRITGAGLISRKTFSRAKSLLNAVFDTALESGIIQNNPSRVCPKRSLKFKQEENSEKVYTVEERDKLIAHLKSQVQTVYTLAIRLAFCFCIRIGELVALTWDDYDEKNRTIHIHHQIVHLAKNGKKRTTEDVPHTKTGTHEGNRYLYVTDEAVEILALLREINGKNKYILTGNHTDSPILANNFNLHLKHYCNEAGIRYLSSHKIRFFGATQLFNAGVDPEQIRRIMGHTTIAMTEHYNRTDGKIAVDKEVWSRIFEPGKT